MPRPVVDCPFCAGEGRGYDPCSNSDPVEGNKMRPLVPCLACKAKGQFYDDDPMTPLITDLVIDLNRRLEREKARRQALAKLTPEEREALGIE